MPLDPAEVHPRWKDLESVVALAALTGERPLVLFCQGDVPEWARIWPVVTGIVSLPEPEKTGGLAGPGKLAWSSDEIWKGRDQPLPNVAGHAAIFLAPIEMARCAAAGLRRRGAVAALVFEAGRWTEIPLGRLGRLRRSMSSTRLRRARARLLRRHGLPVSGFSHDGGACWYLPLPTLADRGDHTGDGMASPLILFEDQRMLGPPHTGHDMIRTAGGGSFSHWGDALWMSASDNSDPTSNGRRYTIMLNEGAASMAVRKLFGGKSMNGTAPTTRDWAEATIDLPPYPDPQTRDIQLCIGYLGPGGAERQICYLAEGLLRAGWRPVVLAQTVSGAGAHFVETIKELGVSVEALDTLNGQWRTFDAFGWRRFAEAAETLSDLPEEIRSQVIDAFFVFLRRRPAIAICYLDMVNIVAGLAAALAGVPRIIVSGRNLNPTHFPYLHRPWMREAYRLLLTCPRVTLMTNSHAGARSYAGWLGLPVERVPVVHNGLSSSGLPEPRLEEVAAPRLEIGASSDTPLVLGIFRISPEKRPHLFIDIIRRLRDQFPDLRGVIAGEGIISAEVATYLRETGQDAFVTLLGRRNDIPALLRSADLMLHVSEAEGVPNALMEAQWMGLPVVATAGGGTREIITPALLPFLHAVDDVDGLVASCEALLNDPSLRRRVGDQAREEARGRFSADALVANILALCQNDDEEAAVVVVPTRKKKPSRVVRWFNVTVVSGYLLGVFLYLLARGRLKDPGIKVWLRSRLRRRVRQNLAEIEPEAGHCYRAPVPARAVSDMNGMSRLMVFEDGRPLGPGHSLHDDIRQQGQGRFSHWGSEIYFSASDNTDPRSNGRTYLVVEG